jgi:glycine/D-amino acid oxidase-like deaminating enzyme
LGGIVGASIAHHLIERGWDDIVGIDKSACRPISARRRMRLTSATRPATISCLSGRRNTRSISSRNGPLRPVGGLEIVRVGDDGLDGRGQAQDFFRQGLRHRRQLIGPAEVKEKFPLVEEEMVAGWLVGSGCRSRRAALADGRRQAGRRGEKTGKLNVFANTPAQSLIVEDGRIKGVSPIAARSWPIMWWSAPALWGRLIAEMAGEDLPVMPVDHPLTFFGPYNEFEGTGKDIGFPLMRDQGNSAYMRDTGDPKTAEGGQIEWGYYEDRRSAPVPSARHPGEGTKRGCRPRSAISTWSRSSSRWNAPWN